MKKLLFLFLLVASAGWCAGPDILDAYRPVPLTDFLLGNSPSYRVGRMFWDTTNSCPAYYPDANGPINQIGQESWIRAYNNTGSPILNGQAVVVSSALAGVIPTASLAKADSASTADVIAVCTYDVAAGAFGYFTTLGIVRDVNTIAWSAGTDLYLSASTAGSWTSTIPASPNYVVQIGRVITSAVAGAVYVRPHVHGSMTRAQFAAGINLGTALAIADGGTGQTASSAALAALGGASKTALFFRARAGDAQTISGAGFQLRYNTEEEDTSEMWNASDTFTAPVSGVYHFDAYIESDAAQSQDARSAFAGFKINGTVYWVQKVQLSFTSQYAIGMSITKRMSAGQTMQVWLQPNTDSACVMNYGAASSHVSGYFVGE